MRLHNTAWYRCMYAPLGCTGNCTVCSSLEVNTRSGAETGRKFHSIFLGLKLSFHCHVAVVWVGRQRSRDHVSRAWQPVYIYIYIMPTWLSWRSTFRPNTSILSSGNSLGKAWLKNGRQNRPVPSWSLEDYILEKCGHWIPRMLFGDLCVLVQAGPLQKSCSNKVLQVEGHLNHSAVFLAINRGEVQGIPSMSLLVASCGVSLWS